MRRETHLKPGQPRYNCNHKPETPPNCPDLMDWAFCTEWDELNTNVLEQYLWGPVRQSLICKHGRLVWKQRPDSNGLEEIFCDDRWNLHSLIKLCLMEYLPDHKHAQLRTNPLLHSNGELSWYEPTAFFYCHSIQTAAVSNTEHYNEETPSSKVEYDTNK